MVLGKTFESPLDCKEIKPANPKGNQSWIFIGRTGAEAEIPILWLPDAKNWLIGKDPDAGKDWGQEEKGQQREGGKWLDNIANLMDISLNKIWEIVKDRKACYAAVHGVANSWTWLSDWTTITNIFLCFLAIFISSLKIYLFKCVQHSKISFSVALVELWFFKNSLYHSITWYTFLQIFPILWVAYSFYS